MAHKKVIRCRVARKHAPTKARAGKPQPMAKGQAQAKAKAKVKSRVQRAKKRKARIETGLQDADINKGILALNQLLSMSPALRALKLNRTGIPPNDITKAFANYAKGIG